MARRHAVALFDEGSKSKNTIVLGAELVLPLEADLDGDPAQDDEVRLASAGGDYEVVLHAHGDDVEIHPSKPVLLYRFRDVPRGTFTLSVKVGDHWSVLVPDLRVKKDGVYFGDQAVSGSIDDLAIGEALDHAVEEEDEEPDFPFYDQPEEASEGA